MFLSTRCLKTDPLTQFHSRLSGWVGVIFFSFVPERRRKEKENDWLEVKTAGWRHEEAMAERKPFNPTNPVQKEKSEITKKKKTPDVHFFFLQSMGLVLRKAHTQHAFTQGQCCVSAILDPLLQFWTKRVVSWSLNGGGVSPACLSTRLASSVGASAGYGGGGSRGSGGVMQVSERRGRGGQHYNVWCHAR